MTTFGVIAHSKKTLGGGLGELRTALTEAGIVDPMWSQVSKSRDAPEPLSRMLDRGVDRVLVWGGDGTVRRCIDTVVKHNGSNRTTGAELGIIPAGTANLLANGLGIPVDLREALSVALHGHVRRIDVGMMNDECFAVMAGTGFDALMIRDADDHKDRLGRLAYVRAGAKHLTEKPTEVSIDVDRKTWYEGPATCVLVGNLGEVTGGLELFPDAAPDDGVLELGVVTAQHRRDWVRVGFRAATGRVDASPLVQVTSGQRIDITLARKMPWELDGGARPKSKRLKVKVLPQQAAICVPAP